MYKVLYYCHNNFEKLWCREMSLPIYRQIKRQEFDYQTLLDVLKDYKHPRDKITDFMRKGVIVRIKKGLYVFGDDYRDRPYSRELLANLIYGPSYISLETALQHHGLIPERVEAFTSVTTGRSRRFDTPAGLFIYRQVPLEAYRVGMTRVEVKGDLAYLIATAAKALSDKIREDRGTGIKNIKTMREYLEDNLRIDPSELAKLDPDEIDEYARRYRSRKLNLLAGVVRRKLKGGAA
jgi:predicted transcriptional regulator of viral defense system